MNRDCAITAALKRRQITMFQQAADRGITAKVIHYDTGGENDGIGLSTLGQWSRGESAMGLPMLIRMIGIIPDDLLSLLLPDGRLIVRTPDDIDHDEVEQAARDFLAAKAAAHRQDSPAGRDIADCEDTTLRTKAAILKAVA